MEARAHGALTASTQAAARFSTHRARNRAWTMANWFSQKSSQRRARFVASSSFRTNRRRLLAARFLFAVSHALRSSTRCSPCWPCARECGARGERLRRGRMNDSGGRASLAAIAAAAACFATPAVYLHARTRAQRRTLRVVHSGVATVLAVQRFESRALTSFFELTAFSVSVPFYALALPLLAWVRRAARARWRALRTLALGACLTRRCGAPDGQRAAVPQADGADDTCVLRHSPARHAQAVHAPCTC